MGDLEQRVTELEQLLGLNQIELEAREPANFDIAPLKKKLQDLELGFVMNVPVDKLRRLKETYTDGSTTSFKDKLRSINFSSSLMERRAELLSQLKHSSDVVLNSDKYSQAVELMPRLDKAGEEAKEAFEVVSRFESEFNEFYEDLQSILIEMRSQLDELDRSVQSAKRKGKS